MIVSASGLVPADSTSYPSSPEKIVWAVRLRRRFRLHTNSRFIHSNTTFTAVGYDDAIAFLESRLLDNLTRN